MAFNMSNPLAGLIPPPTEVNDTHKVYSVAISCIFLCVTACFAVIARLSVRFSSETLGFDDYAIIPATVSKTIPFTYLFAYNGGCIVPVCRLDSFGCIHESQCWSWETAMGDHYR
jgi:hypothetical protein